MTEMSLGPETGSIFVEQRPRAALSDSVAGTRGTAGPQSVAVCQEVQAGG